MYIYLIKERHNDNAQLEVVKRTKHFYSYFIPAGILKINFQILPKCKL